MAITGSKRKKLKEDGGAQVFRKKKKRNHREAKGKEALRREEG